MPSLVKSLQCDRFRCLINGLFLHNSQTSLSESSKQLDKFTNLSLLNLKDILNDTLKLLIVNSSK